MPNTGQTFDLFSTPTALTSIAIDAAGLIEAGLTEVEPIEKSPLPRQSRARLQLAPNAPTSSVARQTVTQFWLAIHLPRWSLDTLNTLQARANGTAPFVVIDTSAQQVIHASNTAAEKIGIEPGMPLNAAYALSSELQTAIRDPQREQAAIERLAEWAGSFTPRVSIEPPDGVLLEVKGSLRLFGGARALHERVLGELQARLIHAQLSMAPTAAAAMCLARHPQAATELCIVRSFAELRVRLAALSIAYLRWPAATLQLLYALGVHTVGDCQRLPRDGLARRIGATLLNELDQLAGRAPQVRRRFVPRERFTARCDFEMEVTEVAHIEHGLQPMIEQLERFLRARQAALQSFKITWYARAYALPPIAVRFAALAWTQAQMWAVLKERLSRVSLSVPVVAMRLYSSALLPLREGVYSGDLFVRATERDTQRVLRLIERLRARLGENAVYGLSLVADHRPELAWKKNKNIALADARKKPAQQIMPRPSRPMWLLASPQALRVVHTRPYYHGSLEFVQGPERIESGWWDGRDVTRDYYIVRAVTGQRLWVYRERQAPHGWFLHGLFA